MSDVVSLPTAAPEIPAASDVSASENASESASPTPVKRKITRAKTTRPKAAEVGESAAVAPAPKRTRKTAAAKTAEADSASAPETQPTLAFEPANAADAPKDTPQNSAPPTDKPQLASAPKVAEIPAPTSVSAAENANDASRDVVSATPQTPENASGDQAPQARGDHRSNDNRQNDNRQNDNRADNRQNANDNRGGNEQRGLRFRGRDGRAEVRRNEPRNDGQRNDGQRGPFRLRGENQPEGAWRGNENAPNGFRPNNRNDNRDGNRSDNHGGRDNRNDGRNDNRGMDRLEREALRAKPELDFVALSALSEDELRAFIEPLGEASPTLEHAELVWRALELQAQNQGYQFKRGLLEILPDAKGFLRCDGYLAGDGDVYVSASQIKRFNLKTGDMVAGQVRSPKEMERHFGLLRVEAINGEPPENMKQRKEFEKLTPIFPDEKWTLETTQENITARIIELVSPLGRGQRGLIVAPPKAGKTTLIKNIANSIALNHPDAILIVLLIDERPEEVTDISRSVRGEVVASTFDETPENHVRVAEMVLEKAKRLVEQKNDVVILLDSLTRLSRASNLVVAPSGRTMSGGLDPAAMHKPKKMFGAARNIEEGGSLTILATALVDTGSRMDEYIFEEFKGTGNCDLVLDRNLFDQRIFPAIDINRSGTRRDDLLMSKEDLAAVYHLRRTLSALDNDKAITLLIDRLKNTKTNDDFMQIVQKSARQGAIQAP